MIPVDLPPESCVVTVDERLARTHDRQLRLSLRKIKKVTGVRFRKVKGGSILVSYGKTGGHFAARTTIGSPTSISISRQFVTWANGKEMRSTFLREIGYALGVPASESRKSVMWPYYNAKTKFTPQDKSNFRSATLGCLSHRRA